MVTEINFRKLTFYAALTSFAQIHLIGYSRGSGTYIAPYYRSSPNYTKADNYSPLGNVYPHTSSVGPETYSDSQQIKIQLPHSGWSANYMMWPLTKARAKRGQSNPVHMKFPSNP